MKNNFGFTFIEILVVVSILAIITTTTISSINSNFEKQSISSETMLLSNLIKDLDYNIGKEITDYKVFIQSGSFYYYSLNENYKDIKQYYTPGGAFTGKIQTNATQKSEINVDYYINEKKIKNYSFSSTGFLTPTFYSGAQYTFHSYIDDYELNEIHVNYYTNLDYKKIIHFVSATDQTGTTYTGMVIQNFIGGKRTYFAPNGNQIYPPLTLQFEYKGINTNLTLD